MISTRSLPVRQRGAVLVVGLIMLLLITLMVTAAFRLSSTNLKSVNNMQSRSEAAAAANKAVEQVIGSWDFSSPPQADEIAVDIDNNGSNDYTVDVAAPVCTKAIAVSAPSTINNECPTGADGLTICAPPTASLYNVIFDIDATATSTSGDGSKVRVHQGISRSLSQAQCDLACPPAPGSPCA
jgi:Tfp pilus assembly protein PilX